MREVIWFGKTHPLIKMDKWMTDDIFTPISTFSPYVSLSHPLNYYLEISNIWIKSKTKSAYIGSNSYFIN